MIETFLVPVSVDVEGEDLFGGLNPEDHFAVHPRPAEAVDWHFGILQLGEFLKVLNLDSCGVNKAERANSLD